MFTKNHGNISVHIPRYELSEYLIARVIRVYMHIRTRTIVTVVYV